MSSFRLHFLTQASGNKSFSTKPPPPGLRDAPHTQARQREVPGAPLQRRIRAGVLLVHEEAVRFANDNRIVKGRTWWPLPQALSVAPHLESVREEGSAVEGAVIEQLFQEVPRARQGDNKLLVQKTLNFLGASAQSMQGAPVARDSTRCWFASPSPASRF